MPDQKKGEEDVKKNQGCFRFNMYKSIFVLSWRMRGKALNARRMNLFRFSEQWTCTGCLEGYEIELKVNSREAGGGGCATAGLPSSVAMGKLLQLSDPQTTFSA